MLPLKLRPAMFVTSQHAHFIGIGGIGMSGIAQIMLDIWGLQVSGSDLRTWQSLIGLAAVGLGTRYEGRKRPATSLGATGFACASPSSAVSPANPEKV